MEPRALRGWLLCQPRPVKLHIVQLDESKSRVLEVQPGMSFAAIAKTVVQLEPVRVEALDKDGQLIRVYEEEEDEEEDDDESLTVQTDGESARFVIVAKLLGDAYKHSTQVAFDKLGELFKVVSGREESKDKTIDALQKMLMKQALAAESGGDEGEGGGIEDLIKAFAQGAAKKAAEDAAAKAVNGTPTNGKA